MKVRYCVLISVTFQITCNLRMSCFKEYYDVYCRIILSLVHIHALCTRTYVQSLRVSTDCPRTVRRQLFCRWTVFAFYRLGWKTAKSAALDVFAHSWRSLLFLSMCISFFVEFARLICRKLFISYFIEELLSCACLRNAHCADYKNLNKKGDAINFLAVI